MQAGRLLSAKTEWGWAGVADMEWEDLVSFLMSSSNVSPLEGLAEVSGEMSGIWSLSRDVEHLMYLESIQRSQAFSVPRVYSERLYI